MGFLTAKELDTPLDFNGPGKVGCLGLGTAAVTVIDDQTSMVDVLYNFAGSSPTNRAASARRAARGPAGCARSLERMRAGDGTMEDLDDPDGGRQTMGIMPGTTICGLADGAAWPIKNAMAKFRDDFVQCINRGRKTPAAAALA